MIFDCQGHLAARSAQDRITREASYLFNLELKRTGLFTAQLQIQSSGPTPASARPGRSRSGRDLVRDPGGTLEMTMHSIWKILKSYQKESALVRRVA